MEWVQHVMFVVVFWCPLKCRHRPPSGPAGDKVRGTDTSVRKRNPTRWNPWEAVRVGLSLDDNGCATSGKVHEPRIQERRILVSKKIKWPLPNGPKARGKRQAAIPGEIPPESTSNSARPLARIFSAQCSIRQLPPTRPPSAPLSGKRDRRETVKLHWNRPKFCQHVVSVSVSSRTARQQTLVFAPSFPPSGDAAGIHSLAQHLTAHPLNSEARRRSFSRPLACVGPSRRPRHP